ncbi:MAG: hypothetical protein AAGH41_02240 [Pseudomonadota bacterium]
MKRFTCSIAIGLMAVCSAASAASVTATFDSDAEGFIADAQQLDHFAAGGNPGGFIRLTDNAPGASFLNFNNALVDALGVGGSIGFDARLVAENGNDVEQYGQITISNGTLSATADAVSVFPIENVWTTYSLDLDASVWGLSTSDFAALMDTATSIALLIESTDNISEIIDYDNVFVSVPEIPIPPAALLAGPALLGLIARKRKKQ